MAVLVLKCDGPENHGSFSEQHPLAGYDCGLYVKQPDGSLERLEGIHEINLNVKAGRALVEMDIKATVITAHIEGFSDSLLGKRIAAGDYVDDFAVMD